MTLLLSCFDDEGEAEGEGEALLADVGGAECWRTLGSLAAVAGAVAALGVVLLFYGLLSAAAVVVAVVALAVWPMLVFIVVERRYGVWPGALGSMLKIFPRYQFPLGKSTFMMQTKHTSLIYKNLMNYR